jgi:hypothetical protein
MIPVPAEYRSLFNSSRAGAKIRRDARADWVCQPLQLRERNIATSKNI